MEGTRLQIRTEGYPDKLTAALGQEAPAAVAFAGNAALLQQRTLALFCSIHCPGAMIMQTYEFVKHLRLRSVSIISGFHSPMERECLNTLCGGTAGIIVVIGKALASYRLPEPLETPFADERVLIVSPFPDSVTRIQEKTARYRNLVVAALADEIFVPYAEPGSHTEAFCHQLLTWEKPLFTLAAPENQGVLDRGAHAVQERDIRSLWQAEAANMPGG